METKELTVNPKVNELLVGISEDKASQLKKVFLPMLDTVQTFEDAFNKILGMEINDETCKMAKRLRLDISKIRTGAAKVKKDQKAEFLRAGRAVDGLYHIVEYAVASKEEKLKEIETYHERIEAERKAKLETERIEELLKYECDGSALSLGEMTDIVWENFLSGTKNNYEAVKEAERKAEADRIEAERIAKLEKDRRYQCSRLVDYIPNFETVVFSSLSDLEYSMMVEKAKVKRDAYVANQEEIRLENARLKKEAEEKEKARLKEEAERKAKEEKARIKRGKEQERVRLENQKKLDEEKRISNEKLRKERESAEKIRLEEKRKQDEKLERERKEKKRIQKKLDDEKALKEDMRLKEEKRLRDAKAAPDKEKLRAILINFDSLRGNLSTKAGREAIQKSYDIIDNAVKELEG